MTLRNDNENTTQQRIQENTQRMQRYYTWGALFTYKFVESSEDDIIVFNSVKLLKDFQDYKSGQEFKSAYFKAQEGSIAFSTESDDDPVYFDVA